MKKDVDKGRMIGYNSQADSEKLRQTEPNKRSKKSRDRSKVEKLRRL